METHFTVSGTPIAYESFIVADNDEENTDSISFDEIFSRAVVLFDDPDIRRDYVFDSVKFQKRMRSYLIGGLGKFSNPSIVASKLSKYNEQDGFLEEWDGDGSNVYILSSEPKSNSALVCKINGKPDLQATYNPTDKSVTFSHNVEKGETCSAEWYYAGGFSSDLEKTVFNSYLNKNSIMERVKDILAHCLCTCYAEKNKNFILEIRNTLNNTDWKIASPANSTKSKIDWYNNCRAELDDLTNKLGWDMLSISVRGSRLGS